MTILRTFPLSERARAILDSWLEYNRIYRLLGLVAVLLAIGCSTGAETKTRIQKDVSGAHSEDLAQGYLAAKTSLEHINKFVKSGAFSGSGASFMIKIRGEVVNKDNVNQYLGKFQRQFSVYEEAIMERGFADVTGKYQGEATKSCAKSNSLFAGAIQQKLVTGIDIRQEGIDAQFSISLKLEGKDSSIGTGAAIAETAIAVIEPTNSDFYFLGEIRDRTIVLKPDVSVLKTWPGWANPPSQSDLENCVVKLERHSTAGAAMAETDELDQEVPVHSYKDGRAAIIAGDYTTAVSILKPLAKKGNADAQNTLGYLYAQGWGVERNYEEALRWYQKAVSQGHAKAQTNLGDLYADGNGVEQDNAKAASLYLLAAKQGNANAQVRLGALYDKGVGVQRDYSTAARWYRKAAEQGHPIAQGLLGAMYAKGEGVKQDYSLAMRWYRKSAEQGEPLSQYNLGHMYEHGEGVAPNKAEAIKWYRMAAEKGNLGAKARLEVLE